MSNIIIKPYIEYDKQIISIFDGDELLGNLRVIYDGLTGTSQWSFNGQLLNTTFFQDALTKAMEIKGYTIDNVEFFARSSKDG